MKFTYFLRGSILARKSNSIETAQLEPSNMTEPSLDFSKIVETSKANIQNEKPKRVRRTKAEIEASRGQSSISQPNQPSIGSIPSQPQINRAPELKPAIVLYSDLFLAKPLEVPALKFSDDEAEALAQVTSNLLNAFPEYFNNSNPKVAAIVGAVIVAGPIGYTKYKIYKQATSEKKIDRVLSKVQNPETKPEQENFSVNGFEI